MLSFTLFDASILLTTRLLSEYSFYSAFGRGVLSPAVNGYPFFVLDRKAFALMFSHPLIIGKDYFIF